MTDGRRDACTCSSLGSEAVVADFLGAADLRRRGAPLLRKSLAARRSWGPTVGPSSKTRWLILLQHQQETLLARRTLAIALA